MGRQGRWPDPFALEAYCRWVEQYTTRQLTFPSDILNAFACAAKIVSSLLDSRLLFGLPERYLPQTLMWEHTEVCDSDNRPPPIRDGRLSVAIPSWSWAHTLAPVDYGWLNPQGETWTENDYRHTASLVVGFHYQDPEEDGSIANNDDNNNNSHGLLCKLDIEEWWTDQLVPIADLKIVADLPALEGLGDWKD